MDPVQKIKSLFVDRTVFFALTTYLDVLPTHVVGGDAQFPYFTPADQTMIMFQKSLIGYLDEFKERHSKWVIENVSVAMALKTYFAEMIGGEETPTYPQFTPAEQTMILLFDSEVNKALNSHK